MENTIDLDALLNGEPTWDEVVAFFKADDFCEESYLVDAIKKHLRTEEQRKTLFDLDLSIEDCLNGRYTDQQGKVIHAIYQQWNDKLGFKHFGG